MTLSRRSILTALGGALPFSLGAGLQAQASALGTPPVLRFRPFEQAVREAFADLARNSQHEAIIRVEIGHSDLVQAGVQGCHNDRPFAGFPAGHLRIVRTSSEPGPIRQRVRMYIATVDVVHCGGVIPDSSSRPLDFTSLPPAPVLC
ncbi:MAG: hypothetical protein JO161_10760 [Planctomycetaceae bacterium]|nr:hypothetical protein [Planctomycetaceae bacterium]